ncbi:MAG: class B sortase [Lachnospiraceae bacterium]|nr:class B sortase [Lachnospiraceae bacterium]MBD5455999.1 class B sortase [Lachnospiraceae bacterium]
MTAEDLTVAGRRFRSRSDYEAALRDQRKIERIKAEKDLDDPVKIYELFRVLKSGAYRFETIVGTDFDDEIYEKTEELRKKGITVENAASFERTKEKKDVAGRTGHLNRKQSVKNRQKTPKESEEPVKLSEYDADMQKQILKELKKQEKRRKLIVILASLVAVACFGYFGIYYFFSARTSMDYEQLVDLKNKDYNYQIKEQVQVHKTSNELPDILPEYQILYQKNKKLIGWLKIDDTNIDYPVMQTVDNEYYLDHNFNQEYDKNGSIFMDAACSVYPRSTNLIVYGHHMKSGKMFGGLQKYAKESYYEDHKTIQFDTIYEKGTYEIMYVFRSQVFNKDDLVFKYYQFINANSGMEFDSYMSEMADLSLYDTGVTAKFGDELLTLSTCDHSQEDGRFVVVAKKIT